MEKMFDNSLIKGKWIILSGDDIIASGDDIKEIIKEAQTRYPGRKFVLAKVPEEGAMIY